MAKLIKIQKVYAIEFMQNELDYIMGLMQNHRDGDREFEALRTYLFHKLKEFKDLGES